MLLLKRSEGLILFKSSLAGEELYLIPGIDMINHSSCAAKRNTALEKSNETEQVDTAQSAPLQRRYFVMTAGPLITIPYCEYAASC